MTTKIGLDIGYGHTKAANGSGCVTFPSLAGPAVAVKYHNDLAEDGAGLEIHVDNARWFVGEQAALQSPFTLSPRTRERDPELLRLLAFAALHRLGALAGSVDLVTGLPIAWYPDREALADALAGAHDVVVNGRPARVEIAQVLVVPQPFGSLFRVLLNPAGVMIDEDRLRWERVAIIDIGMHTTDYAFIDKLRYVEPRSGSIPVAMARVYELVQRAVMERHGLDLDLQDAEAAVRTGHVTVYGRRHAIQDAADEALAMVAQEVTGEAATLWGRAKDAAAVLVTGGGGGALLQRIQLKYPHARLICEPQTANAQGFYRYALRKFDRSA
jgi:plasmid segregation protein ParM